MFNLSVLTTYRELEALKPEWDLLFDSSCCGTVTLHSSWVMPWWQHIGRHYAGAEGGLRVVTFRKGGDLVAVIPLYLQWTGRLSTLRFLGTGAADAENVYPEYLDVLASHEHAARAASELLTHVSRNPFLTAHRFELGLGNASSSLQLSASPRPPLSFRRSVHHCSYFADLNGGFEQYLQSHSGSTRQTFRRLMRSAEKNGVRFEVASSADEAIRFFEEMVELHQERWHGRGMTGAFSSRRVIQFHHEVLRALAPTSAIVSRISVEGTPLAVLYGFSFKGIYHFYQSGMCETAEALSSPGITAHLLTMRELSSHGVAVYDFLAGDSEYKRRLATASNNLEETSILFLSPLMLGIGARNMAARAVRKAKSSFASVTTGIYERLVIAHPS